MIIFDHYYKLCAPKCKFKKQCNFKPLEMQNVISAKLRPIGLKNMKNVKRP